jgi:hypothetical protein
MFGDDRNASAVPGGAVMGGRGRNGVKFRYTIYFTLKRSILSVKSLVSGDVQIAHKAGFFQHSVGRAAIVVT